MNGEIFTQIILALTMIIGALVSSYVVPYIKSKMTTEEFGQLISYIELGVRCANQIYSPEEWKEKKEYVLEYAKNVLKKINIDITNEQLDTIIEGLVNEVKKEG